ncbi:hypothetical protein ABZ557_31790 [Streptomyces sp. NPDC019645]|uniref:hypothetical protein n=1 Tax=Streptomyces sp. NPDC019645 TaxID=3154786 RepID=UPI0033DFF72C
MPDAEDTPRPEPEHTSPADVGSREDADLDPWKPLPSARRLRGRGKRTFDTPLPDDGESATGE